MYLSSATIMNCFAQDATIFSWVKQPLNRDKQKERFAIKKLIMMKQAKQKHACINVMLNN